jgi:predicted protein tyrosine phosphatase
MPFIENVSYEDVKNGSHRKAGLNSMLIQIVDTNANFPHSKESFRKVKHYRFLDVEDTDIAKYSEAITDAQAASIAEDLKYALTNDMNVIVHCHMGVCRSGAVAEVGVMLGFTDSGKWRLPNLMVKHKLMKCLDLLPINGNTEG